MMRLTRRTALQALAVASVAGAALKSAPAAAGATTAVQTAADLLLIDVSLTPGELRAPLRRVFAQSRKPIEADLVIQWRKSLRKEIETHNGPVVALVRWDKALVLSGLAREQQWRAKSQRLSQSVFRIELSKV
jgi:hypothetical protein